MKTIPEELLKKMVLSGVNEFMYLSYDHDAAMDYATKSIKTQGNAEWQYLPRELMNKFPLWRKGKIRSMDFNPDGSIKKIWVSNKFLYKKPFLPSHFGIEVKPIIFESDDEYNLIKQGLAHKNTM